MSEEKHKHESRAGDMRSAYILIGLGVLFLLVNLLNINFGRLWPLILVALGLYMLSGRNSISSRAVKQGRFRAPLEEAQSAEVELHLSVGEARVEPLVDSDDLIDADLTYMGEVDLDVSGSDHKVVRLRQTSDSMWAWVNPSNWFASPDLRWNIGLNRKVPTRLVVHSGVGKALLELRDLRVTDLRLHGGAGQIVATLPASDKGYHAHLHGGVGEMQLTIPADTSATLEVKGGVGVINIDTSGGAVRLKARGGIGTVNVPSSMKHLSGGGAEFDPGKVGLWESDGFEDAPHQVTINYEGGIGELRMR